MRTALKRVWDYTFCIYSPPNRLPSLARFRFLYILYRHGKIILHSLCIGSTTEYGHSFYVRTTPKYRYTFCIFRLRNVANYDYTFCIYPTGQTPGRAVFLYILYIFSGKSCCMFRIVLPLRRSFLYVLYMCGRMRSAFLTGCSSFFILYVLYTFQRRTAAYFVYTIRRQARHFVVSIRFVYVLEGTFYTFCIFSRDEWLYVLYIFLPFVPFSLRSREELYVLYSFALLHRHAPRSFTFWA